MRSLPLSCSAFDSGRRAEAHLAADVAGGRTVLRRQHVGYPFHVTRGFYLDVTRADLLTLYLQSAAGGLYACDRLKLDVAIAANAAFHLTTQASTVVHHGRQSGALQQQSITVGPGAFCAIASDPYVLFPGADLCLDTMATVAEGAVLFLADGFAMHDPRQAGRPFASFSSRQRILRPDGNVLLFDRGSIRGDEMRDGALGDMAAVATVVLIAPPEKVPDLGSFSKIVDSCGCLSGASPAPNQAGLVMRILAPDGGTLARGLEAAFHVAGRAALGSDLARRRK
ncbi:MULTISPECIES: urease accessory protein UreD [unclassified Bradyrhizobium]